MCLQSITLDRKWTKTWISWTRNTKKKIYSFNHKTFLRKKPSFCSSFDFANELFGLVTHFPSLTPWGWINSVFALLPLLFAPPPHRCFVPMRVSFSTFSRTVWLSSLHDHQHLFWVFYSNSSTLKHKERRKQWGVESEYREIKSLRAKKIKKSQKL